MIGVPGNPGFQIQTCDRQLAKVHSMHVLKLTTFTGIGHVLLLLFTLMAVEMKRSVRLELRQRLKALSKDYIDQQSAVVAEKLFALPQFQMSNAFSAYLSMPEGEINTDTILQRGFEYNKRVFIPKITGKKSEDMFKLEVLDYATIANFPKNSWGIPEPSQETVADSVDGTYSGLIDLVVMPGVAFDRHCNRVGHGKGYYGELPYVAYSTGTNAGLTPSFGSFRLFH
jgi:5-formyltetrahydrofolate cyclo-ligase